MAEGMDNVIVLGGGIAGLAAARALGAPIYEASTSPGGHCRSKHVDGFTFDYGIHVLQTNDAVVHRLFNDVGVNLLTLQRIANIYSHGKYTAYPFQVNTAGLPMALRAKCLWGYLQRDRRVEPRDYEQWIYGNVGKGFGDTFLIPYSEKFWTVHPREMTCDWTANRIPQPSTWQVLRGALIDRQTGVGTNAVFQYPADKGGGYGAICQHLAASLVPIVHLNHQATRIDPKQKCIEFSGDNKAVSYDVLVSTIPLPDIVKLIAGVPAAVRDAAARLRCNSIFVVNLGIGRRDVSPMHWAHYPEADICFFRISCPHNFAAGMAPAGTSSVAAEISYSPQHPPNRATLVDRVIDDLVRVRVIRADDPILVRDTMDIEFAYVIYDFHRTEAVRTILHWLESVDIYSTGRYGEWSYHWSHEALLSGLKTAERCLKKRQNVSGRGT